jgi:hypothetical protein
MLRRIRLRIRGKYPLSIPYQSLIVKSFGVIASLLELVPIASILFAFTNTAGAALWAADMEKGDVSIYGTSPHLREQAKKAE